MLTADITGPLMLASDAIPSVECDTGSGALNSGVVSLASVGECEPDDARLAIESDPVLCTRRCCGNRLRRVGTTSDAARSSGGGSGVLCRRAIRSSASTNT